MQPASMESEPDWKAYERVVMNELSARYPDATVRADVRLPGYLSGTSRQIDVLVDETLAEQTILTAVDAKHHARPIDVKQVEEFLGMLQDIRVDRGILVTQTGYSEAALARAFRDDVDLDLDVFTLEELQQWQSSLAIPFVGPHAVILPSPFAWVVDGSRDPNSLALLYRRGLTYQQAVERWEYMYVNFWKRTTPVDSLDALLDKQAADLREHSRGDAVVAVTDMKLRDRERTVVRRAELPQYATAELTGFVEFPDFIFFAVLFTPLYVERRNRRKLEYLLRKIIPGNVKHAA